jgi:hypothetical protein
MSDENYEEIEDDSNGIELQIDPELGTDELVNQFKYLGKFTSSKLASGFSENEHSDVLSDLLQKLGENFPIPVLEMAVKHYRARRTAIEQRILDVMFENGANQITFENGDKFKKELRIEVEITDKENKFDFYRYLERRGYGDSIRLLLILTNPPIPM